MPGDKISVPRRQEDFAEVKVQSWNSRKGISAYLTKHIQMFIKLWLIVLQHVREWMGHKIIVSWLKGTWRKLLKASPRPQQTTETQANNIWGINSLWQSGGDDLMHPPILPHHACSVSAFLHSAGLSVTEFVCMCVCAYFTKEMTGLWSYKLKVSYHPPFSAWLHLEC